MPGATVRRRRDLSRRPICAGLLCSAESQEDARRSEGDEDVSLRALRCGDVPALSRCHHGADLLHQDRLQTRAHLYRQAWIEGPGEGVARRRSLEGAAEFGLEIG